MTSPFVFAVLACSLAAVGAFEIMQCGNGQKRISRSDVYLSCTGNPCRLKKWSTLEMEVAFTPDRYTETITARVTADTWFGEKVLEEGLNVCDKIFYGRTGTRASCPLYGGIRYIVQDTFLVDEDGYGMTAKVEATLKDDRGKNIVCFQINAVVD